jgi:hypothetical protein
MVKPFNQGVKHGNLMAFFFQNSADIGKPERKIGQLGQGARIGAIWRPNQ